MTLTVVHADGFFVDSTHDIPNVDPHMDSLRWWKDLFPVVSRQIAVVCNSARKDAVEAWLRHYGVNFSYVLSLPDNATPPERLKFIIAHAGSQHTKIELFISTLLSEANWMAGTGVNSVYFIRARPITEAYEEDMRTSWEKQSAGIAEVVEDVNEASVEAVS